MSTSSNTITEAPANQQAYVFLHRRPNDKQAWPVVYTDREIAEMCVFRVSDIVTVDMPPERRLPEDLTEYFLRSSRR